MDWSNNWRGAFRIELRAEAIGLACHGWPVLPGTYPSGDKWAGRESVGGAAADLDGPAPVFDDWAERAGILPGEVGSWWSGRPYSLLVATGTVLDAVEVDAHLGRRAAAGLRVAGLQVPIAGTPTGRWLFLTASSGQLAAPLAAMAGVRLHSAGSWIPVPPSPFQHGVVHWRVRPELCGWKLPEPTAVQAALCDALEFAPALDGGGIQQPLAATRTS